MSVKRLVIAGGTGLLGGALLSELQSADWDLVVLTRRPPASRGMPAGARAVEWDGRSLGPWAAAIDGAAAVVNLAGENLASGRWTAARKRALVASRVEPTRALAQAIAAAVAPPRVLLQASGAGHYGSRGDEVIDESSGPGSGFVADLSAAWEAASASVEAVGVRRVLLRTGVVLARHGGALPRLVPPLRWFVGGPFGSGAQWWPWIHIADAAGAMRFLIEHESARGPCHLTAPELVTNRELTAAIGRQLGRPSWLPVPAWGLRLLLGELSSVLLDSQRAPPAALLRAGYRFRFPELAAALRDLLR